jgi:hypothetical protein
MERIDMFTTAMRACTFRLHITRTNIELKHEIEVYLTHTHRNVDLARERVSGYRER